MKCASLRLAEWRETRDALASYARIAGKIRQALAPRQKHWWHITLRASATGFTTTPILAGNRTFEIALDFVRHCLIVSRSDGLELAIPFEAQSQASLKATVLDLLETNFPGDVVAEKIRGLDKLNDVTVQRYQPDAAARYWAATAQIDAAFNGFRSSLRGETSPVQLFPHHFDLSMLWLSGRLVAGQDPEDEENADEQMGFGFSTGDQGIEEPYLYATAYPQPSDFTLHALPAPAFWNTQGFTGAVLLNEALVDNDQPEFLLSEFLID